MQRYLRPAVTAGALCSPAGGIGHFAHYAVVPPDFKVTALVHGITEKALKSRVGCRPQLQTSPEVRECVSREQRGYYRTECGLEPWICSPSCYFPTLRKIILNLLGFSPGKQIVIISLLTCHKGSGEMAQQLTALAALAVEQGCIPRTHIRWFTISCKPSSGNPIPFSGLFRLQVRMFCIYT